MKHIPRQQLKQHVNEVVNKQMKLKPVDSAAKGKYNFLDCISLDDIKTHLQTENLGNIRLFKNTKHSLVFASEDQQKVYKCSLVDNELATMLCLSYSTKVNQVLLPQQMIPRTRFFTFPYLYEPLDILSIQDCFKWFARSVLLALEELHEIGYAHLDVRPPNICFRHVTDDWEAVLIDLDRAIVINHLPKACCTQLYNEGSLMYNETFDSADKYDWRQYALMLARVIEGTYDKYHRRPPKFRDTAEGKTLQECFEYGVKPPLWVIDIDLVDSPKSCNDIFSMAYHT